VPGADTRAVLRGTGLDDPAIDVLLASGVVAAAGPGDEEP